MGNADLWKDLLINEEDVLQNLMERTKSLMKIDRSGNMILLVPRNSLSQKQLVGLAVYARYIAAQLGVAQSDAASIAEIAKLSGTPVPSTTSRLKELKDERIVESAGSRGSVKISIAFVGKLLDEIEETLKRGQ